MVALDRITSNPNIMGGRACIRGMRITVSLVLNLLGNGLDKKQIIKEYPDVEPEDIDQCLKYAAYLAQEELYIPSKAS